jgi:addiction module HigA family antidote
MGPGRLRLDPRDRVALQQGSRAPLRPGRFLETRYLRPLGITQKALARDLGISRRRVNELVQGRRGITPDTAIRLALHFGGDAAFWIAMQAAWDMHQAWRALRAARLARGETAGSETAKRSTPSPAGD